MAVNYEDLLALLQNSPSPASSPAPMASFDPGPAPSSMSEPAPMPMAKPAPAPAPMPSAPSPAAAPMSAPLSMPAPSPRPNFSWGQGLGDDDLQSAQEDARQKRMGVGIAQALSQGIGTITNTKSDPSLYQNLEASSNAGVKNIQAGRQGMRDKMVAQSSAIDLQDKADASDPTSNQSRQAQEMALAIAKKANIPVDPEKVRQLSRIDIDSFMKGELHLADLDQRAKDNQLKREANQVNKQLTLQRSSDDKEEKDASNLKKSLDLNAGNSKSALGMAARNAYAAKKIHQYLKQFEGKEDKMTLPDVYETAKTVDSILSQNGATVSGVEHLIPKTALGDVSQWKTYVTGRREGANQGDFIRQLKKSSEIEQGVADKALQQSFNGALSAADGGRLQKTNPERYNQIVKQYRDQFFPDGAEDSSAAAGGGKPAPYGPVVRQNGHEFKWNAQTGAYE